MQFILALIRIGFFIFKFAGLLFLAVIVRVLVTVEKLIRRIPRSVLLITLLILTGVMIWYMRPHIPSFADKPVSTSQPIIVLTPKNIQRVQATVARAIDGDSIEVILDGEQRESVQLLGVDAPPMGSCYGSASWLATQTLLDNQQVWLTQDPYQPHRDKFGRLLRYVWLSDDRLVNQDLIAQGAVFEYTYFTDYQFQADFRKAEANAQEGKLGIWADTLCSLSTRRPEHRLQTIDLSRPKDLPAAQVVRVIDGDTIEISVDGKLERVRLIGIDTPERGRCYADAATERQSALTTGQTIYLEADSTQDDRDKYNRLLRYIWLEDGRMVNMVLLAEGYAFEYTYRIPYHYTEVFMQLEYESLLHSRGLWALSTCDGIAGRRYSNAYEQN